MVDNSRRYIINVTKSQSCGLSTCTETKQYNVLNPFNITIDGTTCNYLQITTEDVKVMNTVDYESRVNHLLRTIGINNLTEFKIKDRLVEESSFYDPTITYISQLNPDFTVYKFLDGVRVINIGKVSGIAKYKAYLDGENSDDYSWQENPTFLNLTLTSVYVFEVGDFVDGELKASVSKKVAIPLLVPSTTSDLSTPLISLSEVSRENSLPISFSSGVILSNPNLLASECVNIEYEIKAIATNDGVSYSELFCKKSGSANKIKIDCARNDGNSIKIGSVELCDGDEITYNLYGSAANCNDTISTYTKITSVGGMGTTNPTLDLSNCCIGLEVEAPKKEVSIYVDRIEENENSFSGEIKVLPELEDSENINVLISSNAQSTLDGTSYFTLTRVSDTNTDVLISNSNLNPQPNSNVITINSGDTICYEIGGELINAGSEISSEFNIVTVASSNNIEVNIESAGGIFEEGSGDSYSNSLAELPLTVSMCEQTNTVNTYNLFNCGNINLSETLTDFQDVRVCVCGHAQTVNDGFASAKILCIANGTSSEQTVVNVPESNLGASDSKYEFVIRRGDQLKYELCVEANNSLDCGDSFMKIFETYSNTGVNPSINTNVEKNTKGIDIETVIEPISLYLNRLVNTVDERSGKLVLSANIPTDNWIDLNVILNADANDQVGSNSCVIIDCNSSLKTSIDNTTTSQPVTETIRLVGNDNLEYCLCGDYSYAGSDIESKIQIEILNSSAGVNPTITTSGVGSSDVFAKTTAPANVQVSLSESSTDFSGSNGAYYCTSEGTIDLSQSLVDFQEIDVTLCGRAEYGNNGEAHVCFFCKPSGGSVYEPVLTFSGVTSLYTDNCLGTITIGVGDDLCYCQRVETFSHSDYGHNIFKINSVSSNTGANPTIDTSNCCDSMPLYVNCVDMLGTIYSPAWSNCVCGLNPTLPKHINPFPSLRQGRTMGGEVLAPQSINLEFSGTTSVTSGDEASITIWCKKVSDANYTEVVSISGNDNFNQTIVMNSGDVVCYDEITTINHNLFAEETSSAFACLELIGVTPRTTINVLETGSTTSLVAYQTCQTTTTTTIAPNEIYFNGITINNPPSGGGFDNNELLCASLGTKNVLNGCFEICFGLESYYEYPIDVVVDGILTCSEFLTGTTVLDYTCVTPENVSSPLIESSTSISPSILVDSSNINDLCFCLEYFASSSNPTTFCGYSCIYIAGITDISGSYAFGVSEAYPSVICIDSNNIGGGGGGGEEPVA